MFALAEQHDDEPPSSPPSPRWFVQASAATGLILGCLIIVDETLLRADGATERPILLTIAYGFVTGGLAVGFLERWRK